MKTSSKIEKAGKFQLHLLENAVMKICFKHQALAKLHAAAYTISQMQAKMAMDKCHIFDWWMKKEAFIVVLLWENQGLDLLSLSPHQDVR